MFPGPGLGAGLDLTSSASGAELRLGRWSASGGCVGEAPTWRGSSMPPLLPCSSLRPSGASATTSTRSCSGARRAFPGVSRLIHSTARPDTRRSPLPSDLPLRAPVGPGPRCGAHRAWSPAGDPATRSIRPLRRRLLARSRRRGATAHRSRSLLRLNLYMAAALLVAALAWFVRTQRGRPTGDRADYSRGRPIGEPSTVAPTAGDRRVERSRSSVT